jgi:molecular chaperone DnaJ
MQEFYKILGIDEGASNEEVELAYKTLKEKYSKERFMEGEVGNNAAKMLTKVETAYFEICESRKRNVEDGGQTVENFFEVEKSIKEGNFAKAQSLLDEFSTRSAEWHYLQSVVFYKKNWMSESKKQLEIAVNMEPFNSKYSKAYSLLKEKIEYNDRQFRNGNMGGGAYGPNEQYQERQMGGTDSNNCMTFCATWCCMDMLCTMCCR